MTELARSAHAVTGLGPDRRIAAAWNRDAGLGFVTPLVIVPGPGVISNPVVVSGLNSYMLLADVAVGVAGTLVVSASMVRPDLTLWPAMGSASASTAAAGWILVPFGSRGRDQTGPTQGFSSFLVALTLIKTGAGNVTLNAIRLQTMTRP